VEKISRRFTLEIMLSLIAAIGGTAAAVGGFLIAYHQMARDEIERSPAVHLSCRPEFRLAEIAQNIRAPEETLLLTESGGQWVHVGGTLAAKKTGEPAAPEPFARCEVRNYGRLPVLNIRMPLHLQFAAGKSVDAIVDIPGLAPDASYEFSMLDGTAKSVTFAFDRKITVTRVDTRETGSAPLFADERVADLERHPAAGTVAAAAAGDGLTLVMSNFAFKPAELHARVGQTVVFANRDDEAHAIVADDKSFASGAIDPRSSWRHVFTKPGRYTVHCDYHPYMKATVVVD
jgi:plastocyanin